MENLDWLEWEPVTTPLSFSITQHGAFPKQITTVELLRDSELNLVAVGRGTGSFLSSEPVNLRVGELLPDVEDTIGTTDWGKTIRLNGVTITEQRDLLIKNQNLLVYAQVYEAEVLQSELPTITQIEWIVNFPPDDYVFNQFTIRQPSVLFKRERSDGSSLERNLGMNEISSLLSEGTYRDHFRCECSISNQNYSFIAGFTINKITNPQYKPGFLEFENLNNSCLPSEEVKQIILASLSFALGRQLASLGSTSLSENNDRIKLLSRNLNLLVLAEKFYEQSSQPPVPLVVSGQEPFLDEKKISRIISCVGEKMDIIEHSLWLIWIGLDSPLTVRASFFGAAIESLRDSWYDKQSGESNLLINKNIWNRIRDEIINAFNNTLSSLDNSEQKCIDQNNLTILKNKIDGLNNKSSNMKYDEFFKLLHLPIGEVEKEALRERNKTAHGKRYQPSDYYRLPMKMNALYTLYNRLVLKITDASDCYIDYSAYGYPVRHITDASDCYIDYSAHGYPVRHIDEPLGGLESDGKWHK